jgi:hypothetical protein
VNWISPKDRDKWAALVNTGSIKGRKFIDQLSEYKIIKKDSVPWR